MAVVVLSMAWGVVGLGPVAAAPLRTAEPVSAFVAPRCEGTTTADPTDPEQHSGLDNLLSVSGPRLADYNSGAVVPLYDAAGRTEDAPLCGTRQVVGPDGTPTADSQWMFCTSYVDDLCGDVDESGQGTDSDGAAVGPMGTSASHPTLSADAQRLIGYLIENGHSYVGSGADYGFGGTARADAGTSTNTRQALQVLVWCISDPNTVPSEDFRSTCQMSLPAEEQARLLALIPAEPVAELDFDGSGQTIDVGQTARVGLTTNLFAVPITVTASPAGAFMVCSGDATLTGTTLTITPATSRSSAATRIELCATPSTAGPVSVSVSATQASVRQMSWNRSASVAPARTCQVFAAFVDVPREPMSSSASFLALPTPTPTPTSDPTPTPTPTQTPDPMPDPTPLIVTDPPTPPGTAVALPITPVVSAVGATGAIGTASLRTATTGAQATVGQAGLAHTGTDAGSMMLLAAAAGLTGIALVTTSRLRLRRRS